MTPKFLRYGEMRKLQVITFSKPVWYFKARVCARKELFHMV